jgi:hypothetical protein
MLTSFIINAQEVLESYLISQPSRLRAIFSRKKEAGTQDWRKLHDVYTSPDVITEIKSSVSQAERVERKKMSNVYTVFVAKP